MPATSGSMRGSRRSIASRSRWIMATERPLHDPRMAAVTLTEPAPMLRTSARVRALPEWITPLRALAVVENVPHTVFYESGGTPGESAEWTLLAFDPAWLLEVVEGALWRVQGRERRRI